MPAEPKRLAVSKPCILKQAPEPVVTLKYTLVKKILYNTYFTVFLLINYT